MKQALLFPPDMIPSDKAKRKTVEAERISIEDMPNDDMRLVAETIGIEHAVALMQHLSGLSIYIPKNSMKRIYRRIIKTRCNGSNARRLAVELGLTESYVRTVANEKGSDDE